MDVRKRLENELNAIERELRIDLPKEILRAREHGDLSENAEFKAAKERQRYLDGRKAQLQAEKETQYTLVSPEESDIAKGLISISSPIGRGLLGRTEGEEIEIVTPSGKKECEIRKLTTIHDISE
jgi:transcription elongation factor GreA